MKKKNIFSLSLTALMIALCYISFTFLKVSIPTPLGYTSFHLGNTFLILASLLLGGVLGGIAGAIGMGIGDLLDPVYVLVAPKTIFLKMMIGLATGFFAHKVYKIGKLEGKELSKKVFLSSFFGICANIIGEPCFGYLYYKYILNMPEKALKALFSFNLMSTSVNAVLAVVIASSLYLLVRKRFKNSSYSSLIR